ncbi:AAA-like domain-containing protein [Seinonella peptonophila]|uniref:AAA-like domain-containing protein n=1 Tax=Seinonella peptonophila TaxID=112248 RepID=A0A1M4ZZD2_9BACL|nr:ATP-binding protein [Seinonella peptonophila]SHF23324.1 AAA-like domain-containing protein [Seinonella peptonophila]
MIHLPTEIRENIAIIQGVPWAFGKFITHTLSGLSDEERLQQLLRAESFFREVVPPGQIGCLWLIKKRRNWENEFEHVVYKSPLGHHQAIEKARESWLELIQKEEANLQYEYLFGMQLPFKSSIQKKFIHQFPIDQAKLQKWIRSWIGTSLSKRNTERFQQVFQERTAGYAIEPCSTEDIIQLYQQHNFRGLPSPTLRPTDQHPDRWDFLMPNVIENQGDHIRLESAEGLRYMTFLTISIFPSQITVPGFDLFYDLQAQGLPVDVHLRWEQKPYKEAKLYSERRKKLAISNRKHMGEVEEDSILDDTIEAQAEQMEAEIQSETQPLNMMQLVFVVTADHSPNELNYYVKLLKRYLEQKGMTVHRSTADQGEYYDAWLPSSKWSPMGFCFPILPNRTAALATPGAVDSLGDPNGLPVGFLRSNRSVVRLNVSWGAQVDQSSNIVIVGQTGSGKTHLTDTLVRNTLLTTRSRGLYIDIKGEHRHWGELPGLKGEVQVMTLDGYEHPGILDPFRLIQRLDHDVAIEGDIEVHRLARAREIAYDMLLQILDLDQDQHRFARRNELLTALDQVCTEDEPCMAMVVEVLEKSKEKTTQQMGQYLRRMQELPLGKLIFGNSVNEKGLVFPRTGLIILGMKQIHLPELGQLASAPSERVSEACMTGMAVLVEQFLIEGKQKGVFSFFVGDEGYFFVRSAAGAQQVERNFRLGRSSYCGNILCSQNPDDIPDSLLNHVSTYVCLGTKTASQTQQVMRALGVDDPMIYNDLMRLGIEQSQASQGGKLEDRTYSLGYLRDLNQKVGLVEFRNPEPTINEFFKTRPIEQE